MFTQLMSILNDKDTISVAITRTGDVMSVSVVPGKRIKGLSPIVLTGSAEEIQAGFAEAMTKPLEKIGTKLIVNSKEFDESIEEAKDEAVPKKKTDTSTPKKVVKGSNEDKFKDIDKLIAEKKFEEAKKKLIRLEDMSSGTLKKEAAAKLYKVREELMKLNTLDFEAEAKDESSEVVIPAKRATIKEIADASPNVIIAKMPPNPSPQTEIPEASDDFDDEEEVDDFTDGDQQDFDDDDF